MYLRAVYRYTDRQTYKVVLGASFSSKTLKSTITNLNGFFKVFFWWVFEVGFVVATLLSRTKRKLE